MRQRVHAKPLRRRVRRHGSIARIGSRRGRAHAQHDTPVTADGNVSWTRKRLQEESRRAQDRPVRASRPARRAGGRWQRRRPGWEARRVEARRGAVAWIGDRRVLDRACRAEHLQVGQPDVDAAGAPGIARHAERDGLHHRCGRCIRGAAGVLSTAARRHPSRRTAGAGMADADHRRRRHRPEDGVHEQDEQGGEMGDGTPHDFSTPDRMAPGKSRSTGSSDRSAAAPSGRARKAPVR